MVRTGSTSPDHYITIEKWSDSTAPQLRKKSPVLDNVISLVVNGVYKLIIQSNRTLHYVFHDKCGLTGTKEYGHQ